MKASQTNRNIILSSSGNQCSPLSSQVTRSTARKRRKTKLKHQKKDEPPAQDQNIFLPYIQKRRYKFLKEKLYEYYGKNFPINYRESYDFDEQWKNNMKSQNKNTLIESISQNSFQIALSTLTIMTFTIVIWVNSIIHFFDIKQDDFLCRREYYMVGLTLEVINVYLKLMKSKYQYGIREKLIEVFRKIWIQILTVSYFLARQFIDYNHEDYAWNIFEGLMLVLLYIQTSKRYYRLRLLSFCLQYEYQTKLFDMLITIFIITHFIAIVLYSATKFDPENNWLNALNLDKEGALTVYNYSFYFTVTTIMTVGYGDITPQNKAEITIVSFVEIFGIIMFGYMINQIGYCISSLRKSRESIDRDLFVVEKLCQHYHMNEDLANKVRTYLVDAKPKLNQVLPEEEKGILMKLNEEIREDMQRQNMISVVKSSVFFICRWTRVFQEAVSRNLTHIMAYPNDLLYQPAGKERIYIIRSGKVHVYAQRAGSKKGMHTPLKSIENNIKKDISDNCYGLSAVLSIRPTKLYAISQDFTSCYYIEKAAFLQSAREKMGDFEYYHEIKSKIDQSKHCESSEVPRLESSKHHYSPSLNFLIQKYSSDKSGHNERVQYLRFNRNSFRGCKYVYNEDFFRQFSNKYFNSLETMYRVPDSEAQGKEEKQTCPNQGKGSKILDAIIGKKDIKDNLDHYFESSKEYTNYFVKNNKQSVLLKYQSTFFFPRNELDLKTNFNQQMYKVMAARKIAQISFL